MEKKFTQPSVMSTQAHFSRVPRAEIQRSRFARDSDLKSTYDAGNLVPVFVDEVLPGDTYHMSATLFSRLATPLKPFMDNLYQDVHFFFVPNRLVWSHWVNFMGERASPTDDPTDYSVPQGKWYPKRALTHATGDAYCIGDYLGLPKSQEFDVNEYVEVSDLIIRAITLIWNEWYRDENLQEPLALETGEGENTLTLNSPVSMLPRGKRKDYFTSCLPWPQKGDAITIPLGDYAPVHMGDSSGLTPAYPNGWWWSEIRRHADGDYLGNMQQSSQAGLDPEWSALEPSLRKAGSTAPNPSLNNQVSIGTPIPEGTPLPLRADLAAATATTINALRTAFQLQKMLERDARGGTRYIESIWAHFGVVNPDFRLQRPEFIGSASAMINVNPIAATFTSSGNAPQGNLAAVGTGVVNCNFTHSFTEHGYIIGFVSARADLTYQRGVERFWSRKVREEFYFPSLAHLGEQAVLNQEIFLRPADENTNGMVFGYQERYAEYRYKPSRITGLFASEETASLDVWHLSQDFPTLPELNESFIIEQPPVERVIAVQTEPHFLLNAFFSLKCDRPMPIYSVPGLIDHF